MLENKTNSPFSFLHNTPVLVVTGLLVLQIVLFNVLPTKEQIPSPPPLDTFVKTVGPWVSYTKDMPVDPETQALLKADDTMTRKYAGPGEVELFVAFFKSQRAGVTPHSPKVCLPANGWEEETAGIVRMDVGEPVSIPVNRYIVSKDGQRNLVFYWYQNQHRVTANEYLSKFYLVWDSLRYHRSDEALIRVIVPIDGKADDQAEANAKQFIRDVYQPLKRQIWSGQQAAELIH